MRALNNQMKSLGNRSFRGLPEGFAESARLFPLRPALTVEGRELTYEELGHRAARIASAIAMFEPCDHPLGAVLASRSITAYAAILGILSSGKGYVPLNPKFPIERTRNMLARSGARVLLVDHSGQVQLSRLLSGFETPLTIVAPEGSRDESIIEAFPQHLFIWRDELPDAALLEIQPADSNSIAYLLFTSGSTGEPKGVPISHSNVCSYIASTRRRYGVDEHDRLSQEFDLTFDLSVHDMFLAWESGACVCCVPEKAVMAPAKFIRESELTMWFSVPSVIGFLSKMKLLVPKCFPTLRWSLFCGESLPAGYAEQWQQAAPNSVVENLYGPTETTIAITRYRWDSRASPSECLNGIVPIGQPYEGQCVAVVDQDFRPVPVGQNGELCLGGSQVTQGYWNDPQKTAQQFVRLEGDHHRVWYRTGDLVKQSPDGCLRYVGRADHQVKIRGYRVELQEIEGVLRVACKTEQVAAVPWPLSNGNADGIVAFITASETANGQQILENCREVLPDYMIPRKIYRLEEMPLNSNGKIDRKTLSRYLLDGVCGELITR